MELLNQQVVRLLTGLFVGLLKNFASFYVVIFFLSLLDYFFLSGSFPGVSRSPALSVFFVVFFLISAHVIFCLQVTSYIRTIITKHKIVPEQFVLSEDQLEQLDQAVSCANVNVNGS